MTRIVINEQILDDTMTAISKFMTKVVTRKIIFDDGETSLCSDFVKIQIQILNAITESKEHAQKLLELQHACMDGVDLEDTP